MYCLIIYLFICLFIHSFIQSYLNTSLTRRNMDFQMLLVSFRHTQFVGS